MYYRRRDLTDTERALAGVVGFAVGAVTFYLARIWLQREPIEEGPPERLGAEVDVEGAERPSR